MVMTCKFFSIGKSAISVTLCYRLINCVVLKKNEKKKFRAYTNNT